MLRQPSGAGPLEAGVDEAGRGCLAGPVFAAAVILPPGFSHPLLADSKQVRPADREVLRVYIEAHAVAWGIGTCDHAEIDALNILQATFRLSGFVEPADAIPPDGTMLIGGSSSCSDTVAGSVTVVGEVTQIRGAVIVCSGNVGSDPRIDGSARTVLNGDQQADESAAMWGTEEITVDGAITWAGDFTGTVAPGYTTHRFAGSDLGYGPYAGLVYDWTMIGDPASGYVTSGTIQPAP